MDVAAPKRDFAGNLRFRVLGRLGAGGMGVVYEALDRERGAKVALKTLNRLDEAEAVLRFKREFRALQDLHHPNLIHLGELFHDDGCWFFTMELVDGVDFIRWVRGGEASQHPSGAETALGRTFTDVGAPSTSDAPTAEMRGPIAAPQKNVRFDEGRLRRALVQLARGLEALHAAGKVHRDVKPSNVLVGGDGRVVLLDFGVASDTLAADDVVVGTVGYMAPEQAAGQRATPAADWYAVGVMLYEALTGGLPFWGALYQVLAMKQAHAPTRPRLVSETVPSHLDELCIDLLHPDPARRPDGAQVLARLGATSSTAPRRSSALIGRTRELAALANAFAATAVGRAVTVVVEGESGIGKSALVSAFCSGVAVESEGALVLAGRCHERELVPYRALDGAIDALSQVLLQFSRDDLVALLPDDAALLGLAFPVLRRLEAIARAPSRGEIVNPHELRLRTFGALRELLKRLARKRRLVVVIDDLQWADADSLALLEEVLRLPAPPALLLVSTLRPVEGRGEVAAALPGEVRRLALTRLDAAESEELVRALLAQSGCDNLPQSSAIASEAAGHPLFIDELVRHALGGHAHSQPLKVDDALWARLSTLDRDDRALVMLVAVAGAPVSQEAIAWAAGLAPDDLTQRVAALRAGHLIRAAGARAVDALDTFHDRVRESVYSHLSPPARQALHRRLAEALEASRGDAEALAVHWQGAGEPKRAVRHALAAAEEALEKLAFTRAARLFQLALTLGARDAGRLEARRGEALANAGLGKEAAGAYLAAAAHADGTEALELRRRAAEQLLFTGHIDEGLAVIAPIVDRLGVRLAATPRDALARIVWHRARLRFRGLEFEERAADQLPAIDRIRIDAAWTVALGLSNVDPIRAAAAGARHLRLALDAGEPYRVARALALEAGFHAVSASSRARGRQLLDRARALADRIGHPHAQAFCWAVAGIMAHLESDYAKAYRSCARAEELLRTRCVGATCELDQAQMFALYALTYLGQYGEVKRLFPLRVREARERGDRYAETNLRIRVGHLLALAEDDPEGARREVREALTGWSRVGFQQTHLFALFAEVDVDLYCGDGAAAYRRMEEAERRLLGARLTRVDVFRMNVLGIRARAALAAAWQAGGTERTRLERVVERDARALLRTPNPLAHAWARAALAGLAYLRGRDAEAVRELEAVAADLGRMELHWMAAAANHYRGVILGGSEGQTLMAAAEELLDKLNIKNPLRMCGVLVSSPTTR